jgi:hypothetical protein
LHGGDRVLRLRHVNGVDLLAGRLLNAVQRHRVRRRELLSRERAGFGEDLRGLSPPGSLAVLALVGDKIVISRDAVARGGKRVFLKPAAVKLVG